jgi:signal transduction histidine kinase/integral membrane sensor domain MASE1
MSVFTSLPESSAEKKQALWPMATLAVLYALTGWMGSLVAAPPGYATLVWPAAGLALGTTLIFGRPVLPGVFLGSLIINCYLGGLLSPSEAITANKLAVPLAIAAGATLQALAGHYLIVRFWGLPIKLQRVSDVISLFLLAGPVACLVSATAGVCSLYVLNGLPANLLLSNWFTWWGGDTLGLILILPLIFISPFGASILMWRGRILESIPLAALLVLVLPLAITFYTWTILSESIFSRAMNKFQGLALESEKALIHRLASYDHALDAGQGFVQNVPQLTREGWAKFVEALNLPVSFPGIRGFGLVERVKADGVPQFLERMRRDGAPDFTIHPATANPEHFVITNIEPIAKSLPALGLDLAFEQKRRDAAMLSIESGKTTLTGRLILVQAQDKKVGFLILHPVYDGKRVPETVEERKAKLLGWVYAPFIAQDFMQDLTKSQGDLLNLTIFDGDSETNDALIYTSETDPGAAPLYSVRKTVEIMQQRWTLVWTSTPSFERLEKRREADFVLFGGTLFSALFGVVLLLVAQRKGMVERLVAEQTIALRSQHRELEGTRSKLQEANDELEQRVKARTAELEAARLAAEAADRAKTVFLSNISHELRTPMHAILSYAEICKTHLEDSNVKDDQLGRYLNNIGTAGKRLTTLINNLLDITIRHINGFPVSTEKEEFSAILKKCLIELESLRKAKNISIDVASETPNTVALCDKNRMAQVVINVLSNALKYSPKDGAIKVTLSDATLTNGRPGLLCRIEDRGPGIPEDELELIFDQFTQSSATQNGAGGSGLGLSISRKIIEAHEGRIWAENASAGGAVFQFTLMRP